MVFISSINAIYGKAVKRQPFVFSPAKSIDLNIVSSLRFIKENAIWIIIDLSVSLMMFALIIANYSTHKKTRRQK